MGTTGSGSTSATILGSNNDSTGSPSLSATNSPVDWIASSSKRPRLPNARPARAEEGASLTSPPKKKAKSNGKSKSKGKGKGQGKRGVKKEGEEDKKPRKVPKPEDDPVCNPFLLADGTVDPAFVAYFAREPPRDRTLVRTFKEEDEEGFVTTNGGHMLQPDIEEDVKPIIREAYSAARLAALDATNEAAPVHDGSDAGDGDDGDGDDDDDIKPNTNAPIAKDHPAGTWLRSWRKEQYADHPTPPEADCEAVCNALADAHYPATLNTRCTSRERWPSYEKPEDEDQLMYGVIRGILSIQSPWRTTHRIMHSLPRIGEPASDDEDAEDPAAGMAEYERVRLPVDWRRIMAWDDERIFEVLRSAGNQYCKVPWVRMALAKVVKWQESVGVTGEQPSLTWIRRENNIKCLEVYTSFANIGPMTALNMMGWFLGRNTLGVDSNALRIARMLGWVPPTCNDSKKAAIHLNLRIPKRFRYALHELFWIHGTSCDKCSVDGTSEWAPITGKNWCPIEEMLDRTKAVAEAVAEAGPVRGPRTRKSKAKQAPAGRVAVKNEDGGEEGDDEAEGLDDDGELSDEEGEIESEESEAEAELMEVSSDEEDDYRPNQKQRKLSAQLSVPTRRSGRHSLAAPVAAVLAPVAQPAVAQVASPTPSTSSATPDLVDTNQSPTLASESDSDDDFEILTPPVDVKPVLPARAPKPTVGKAVVREGEMEMITLDSD